MYLNCCALHDAFGFVLIPLKLFESTAGDDRLDLLLALPVRKCDQYAFEKFPELRKLGAFVQVERAGVRCPQETKGNLGHGTFLVARTSN